MPGTGAESGGLGAACSRFGGVQPGPVAKQGRRATCERSGSSARSSEWMRSACHAAPCTLHVSACSPELGTHALGIANLREGELAGLAVRARLDLLGCILALDADLCADKRLFTGNPAGAYEGRLWAHGGHVLPAAAA